MGPPCPPAATLPTCSSSWCLTTHLLYPSWPSPPLLPVWMNASSLTPWLSDFHTIWFSVSSGYFLFLSLLSFFWLCKEAKCIYLCLHLGQKYPFVKFLLHQEFCTGLRPRWHPQRGLLLVILLENQVEITREKKQEENLGDHFQSILSLPICPPLPSPWAAVTLHHTHSQWHHFKSGLHFTRTISHFVFLYWCQFLLLILLSNLYDFFRVHFEKSSGSTCYSTS